MFKKRVKQNCMKTENEIFAEILEKPGEKNRNQEQSNEESKTPGQKDLQKAAFTEIPLSLMFKKGPEDEERAQETKAERQKNLRLAKQLEKNYEEYENSELLLRKKAHYRSAINVDFHPYICKDFMQNGYCTWGKSCLYAHDRTDYKRGWELEEAWEKIQLEKIKSERQLKNTVYKPEECFLCKKPYTLPVETNCKHHFCEGCILGSFKESKKCPICKTLMNGVFNIFKPSDEPIQPLPEPKAKNYDDMSEYLKPITKGPRMTNGRSELEEIEIKPVVVNQHEFEENLIK